MRRTLKLSGTELFPWPTFLVLSVIITTFAVEARHVLFKVGDDSLFTALMFSLACIGFLFAGLGSKDERFVNIGIGVSIAALLSGFIFAFLSIEV